MAESASIKAISLTRKVFEHIHGNLGVLKFNIEELTPTNGTDTEESKKWDIICTFYETLGSEAPSKFRVSVDLNTNTVRFDKVSMSSEVKKTDRGSFVVKEKKESDQE